MGPFQDATSTDALIVSPYAGIGTGRVHSTSIRLYETLLDPGFHSDGSDLVPLLYEPFYWDRNDEEIDEIAEDPAFHIEMRLEPGEINYLENNAVLHARTELEDSDEPGRDWDLEHRLPY